MSQENTNQPRNEGGQRRQGNNNNRNNSRNRNRNRNNQGGNRNRQGSQSGQGRQNNQGGNQTPQRRHQRKPLPLTTWEKILKFFGLYKEPTRPPRRNSGKENEQVKLRIEKTPESNTRTAKGREPRERKVHPVETPRLYLGNLSYDADESSLEELFKGVGTVRSVEIVYNRHTHRSKGFGFIEMQSISEAKRAVEELHDQPFMGRNLVINGANSKPKEDRPPRERKPREEKATEDRGNRRENRGEKRERPSSSNSKSRLHVANISYEVDESSLEEHFKGIGHIRRVEIAYNSQTHQSKGFGFVEMKNADDAQRAIEVLNDQPFMGRKIAVSLAGSKSNEEKATSTEAPAEPTQEKEVVPAPTSETPSEEVVAPIETTETPKAVEPAAEQVIETPAPEAPTETPVVAKSEEAPKTTAE